MTTASAGTATAIATDAARGADRGIPALVAGMLLLLLSACALRPPAEVPAPPAAPVAPAREPVFVQKGVASWYGPRFHGRRTASGERFDQDALTAAHRTLPMGTIAIVRNPGNGRAVRVRINDRGPHVRGRVIDLSRAAARRLGILERGVAPVVVEVWPQDGGEFRISSR